ncbi:50S ribosomal protein L25 [Singulisphaera sp. PoT]|uniref:50S ribosomal protein L25 n=1 Tax=Singulisphaera sp. PoT TaxID=3411797 RepID=UPI003BF51304
MADAVKIAVAARDPQKNKGTGSRVSRRLRAKGQIPAVIYGHKQPVVTISVPRDTVWDMIKKSTHLAELSFEGGTSETVIVRDIQWDHLGKEIIHLDFARVSAEESVETEVRLDIRGTAPGVSEGGILEQPVHAISVTCRANAIPDSIRIDVSNLHLNQSIHVKELVLPEGVKANADADLVLVHVVTPGAEAPAAGEGETATQPEVIKPERKDKEE